MEQYEMLPLGAQAWHVDPPTFIEQMQHAWPAATISVNALTDSDVYRLVWEIIFDPTLPDTRDSPLLTGGLHRDRRRSSMFGDFEPCVDFACWYRSLMPAAERWLFQDERGDYPIELRPDTTRRAVLKRFAPTLTALEWQILHYVAAAGGIRPIAELMALVPPEPSPGSPVAPPSALNQALDHLWHLELISSPGVRWLPARPPTIINLVPAGTWLQVPISLTGTGERALRAHSA